MRFGKRAGSGGRICPYQSGRILPPLSAAQAFNEGRLSKDGSHRSYSGAFLQSSEVCADPQGRRSLSWSSANKVRQRTSEPLLYLAFPCRIVLPQSIEQIQTQFRALCWCRYCRIAPPGHLHRTDRHIAPVWFQDAK